jgi:hypothetical protein
MQFDIQIKYTRKELGKNAITVKGREDLRLSGIPLGSGNLSRYGNIISVNYCVRTDMESTV